MLDRVRAPLERIAGVERVLIDHAGPRVWILAAADSEPGVVEGEARAALTREGLEADTVELEVVYRTAEAGERERVRFLGVERTQRRDGRVEVRVRLAWKGIPFEGEAVGEASAPIEQRTAATAALKAIEASVGEPVGYRLIGVKQLRAFDQDITVVSLFRGGDAPQRLVGAVLTAEEPLQCAAIAVLNALNRILGKLP
jgi:hypothetical protein